MGTDSEGFRVNTCDTEQKFLKRNRNPALWKPGGTLPEEIRELGLEDDELCGWYQMCKIFQEWWVISLSSLAGEGWRRKGESL